HCIFRWNHGHVRTIINSTESAMVGFSHVTHAHSQHLDRARTSRTRLAKCFYRRSGAYRGVVYHVRHLSSAKVQDLRKTRLLHQIGGLKVMEMVRLKAGPARTLGNMGESG